MPEALFNISRFLLMKTQDVQVEGVSQFTITYTLIKQARILGAHKLVTQLFERLRGMKVPACFMAQVEVSTLAARAYPYRDPEELLPLCYRCSTFNSLLPANNIFGNQCVQCGLKFQHSFVMFGEEFRGLANYVEKYKRFFFISHRNSTNSRIRVRRRNHRRRGKEIDRRA